MVASELTPSAYVLPQMCPALYVGAGDLKSGPYAFIVHSVQQSIHNPCFFS